MDATLRLPATLDALSPIRDFVEEAAVAAGLDRRARYRLRLAVDEIATNVIVHGYDEAGLSGDVLVTTHVEPDALRVVIEDDAAPFDPYSLTTPDDLDAPLEERGIGGLGVFLTIRGVDEFRYQRIGERNRNVFIMRRGGAGDG
jgi:serine/threonine-protein kinase RsbW